MTLEGEEESDLYKIPDDEDRAYVRAGIDIYGYSSMSTGTLVLYHYVAKQRSEAGEDDFGKLGPIAKKRAAIISELEDRGIDVSKIDTRHSIEEVMEKLGLD